MRPGRVFLLLLGWTCTAHSYSNVALRGKASQSSQAESTLAHASNAIDGNRESDCRLGSCSHTVTETNPWWRVDLLDTYVVTSIVVVNRGDCCAERLDGAEIHVGNSLQQSGAINPRVAVISHIPAGQFQTFTFDDRSVQGRYVFVVVPGTSRILTLSEVEVYGYRAPTDNLAILGKASQSSVLSENTGYLAIDGNRASGTDSCPKKGVQPLVETEPVIQSIPGSFTQGFNCNGMDGRYVNIVIPGRAEYLHVCEVEVYGSVLD